MFEKVVSREWFVPGAEVMHGDHLPPSVKNLDGSRATEEGHHARRGTISSHIGNRHQISGFQRWNFQLFCQAIQRSTERTDDIHGDPITIAHDPLGQEID